MKRNGSVFAMAAGFALALGCAGAQKKDSKTAGDREPLPDETPSGAVAGREDATSVLSAKSKQPEVKVTEEQREDFEKAVANYERMRKAGPLKGGDCDDAASAFRKVADRTPALLIARHNEASVYYECGRRKEAEKIWEELARKNYAPALTNLGLNAFNGGNAVQAESYFVRAIEADQQVGSIEARINLAQILRDRARRAGGAAERQNFNKQAIDHLRRVLALDGDSLQAYANLCYIYYDAGYPDAAILIGRQAIAKGEEIATGKLQEETAGPTDLAGGPAAEKERGSKRRGKKDKDDKADSAGPKRARQVAGTGWTTDMKKHVAVVYNTLGLVDLDKKRFSFAISNFKRAVEMDPDLAEARLNLAALSLKFRDYGTAEENLKAVIGAQPRNYDAMIGLGVALRGNRKFDEAEQQYLAAQKLDPNRADSYFNLGLLYQEYKGSEKPTLQKAQQYYRDFIQRSNGSKLKGEAQKRIKDIDELFVALEEARKLQEEAERLQKQAEEQQKKMEEELKKQEAAEKAAGAAAPAGGAAAPAGAEGAAGAAAPGTAPAADDAEGKGKGKKKKK